MSFVNAKEVTKTVYWCGREIRSKLTTKDSDMQHFHLYMPKEYGPNKTEILLRFDKDNPSPKKLSISAVQDTMDWLPLTLSCYKKGARKPYFSKEMVDLCTRLELLQDTTRIVITCTDKHKGPNPIAVRLTVNYRLT